jgi:hypothetical protein
MLTRRTLLRAGVMSMFLGWSRPARAATPLRLTRAGSSDFLLLDDDTSSDDIAWVFRDRRTDEVSTIDPELVRVLRGVQWCTGTDHIELTSGYRTEASNRECGGAPQSFHLRGQAMDIVVPGWSPAEIARIGRQVGAGGTGIYTGFTHLDTGPNRRWSKLPRRRRRLRAWPA